MPCGIYFSFDVRIGGKTLQEHEVDSKQYISVDLHGKDSYVVEETGEGEESEQFQKYPVTPFAIKISKEYDYPCWFTMFMDGEKVFSFPIANQGRCSRIRDGYKSGNEIRELAFSLPRISHVRTLTKSRQEAAGTIRLVCEEAIPHHMEMIKVPQRITTNSLPQTTSYPQLTKRDVTNIKGGMGVVCREGRTVVELQYDKCSYRQRVRLTRGALLEELTLHYRSKEVLQDLGVVSQDVEQDVASDVASKLTKISISTSPTQKSKEHPDKENHSIPDVTPTREMKQEQIASCGSYSTKNGSQNSGNSIAITKEVKREQINSVASTPNGKTPTRKESVPSPITIKHEQIRRETEQANLIEVKSEVYIDSDDDDDIVYIDTTYIKREPGDHLDDSVIYMGDDSCYEVDIPEEEVSVMDLCEED